MSNPSTQSFSPKQAAIQVAQILLPLTLVSGFTVSMGTMTEAIESSRQDAPRLEVSTDRNFSNYCPHLGVQVKPSASTPLEERGALASDAVLGCLPEHW